MSRGVIATAVKGAFKVYLIPAMRTRHAVASVAEGWHDLVTQARQEHEADKQASKVKTSPPMTGPSLPANAPESSASPTLVEAGESSVEVRPNPAISPAHATAGVIGHVPPEVRHRLAGDGPIRA
jgi:hypothetical protein